MIAKMGSLFSWAEQCSYNREQMRVAIERRRATFASMNIRAGERVVLGATASADFFSSLLALWSMRASAVPLDTRLTAAETEALRIKSGANHCLPAQFEDTATIDPIHEWPAPSEDEALLLFTTGTLSDPRGVRLSSRAVHNKIFGLGAKLCSPDFERTLCVLPLSFGHGLIANSLMPWLNGNDLTVTAPLDVAGAQEFPDILKSRQIRFFSSVPGMWALLSRMIEPQVQTELKRIYCASAPLGENIFREIGRLFPRVSLHNVYGLTEMASWVAVSPPLKSFSPGFVGFPLDGEIRVTDGELEIRGDSLMSGYLGGPLHSPDDWFKTGDLAEFSDASGLFLRGRAGNIVNRGGVKIQLEEIEAVLLSHENVKEALGFKTADPDLGESFELAVVLNQEGDVRRTEIQAWFCARVSAQRRPKGWHFTNALPSNTRGKPDRSLLKAKLER